MIAVKKGQLLIRIKGDQYVAQNERLEANLQSAKANLKMREAERDKVELRLQSSKRTS